MPDATGDGEIQGGSVRAELVDTRFTRLHAEADEDFNQELSRIAAVSQPILFRMSEDDSGFQSKYGFSVEGFDEADEVKLSIDVELVLEFSSVTGAGETSQPFARDQAKTLINAAGPRIALPYLREAVDSLSGRLGGPRIRLGFSDEPGEPQRIFVSNDVFADMDGAEATRSEDASNAPEPTDGSDKV
jgi:hypothetical protein